MEQAHKVDTIKMCNNNVRGYFIIYSFGAKVRIKLTIFQRSVSESLDSNAGICEPGNPFVIHSYNCASVWTPGMACLVRSAGRGLSVMPTGPSPLPDSPWQGTQFTLNNSCPAESDSELGWIGFAVSVQSELP